MGVKEFLKPDWRKIFIFFLLIGGSIVLSLVLINVFLSGFSLFYILWDNFFISLCLIFFVLLAYPFSCYISGGKKRGIFGIAFYYLIAFTVPLMIFFVSVFLSGYAIEDPTNYCEKNDCAYCEKDADCTITGLFEEIKCCPSACSDSPIVGINVVALNTVIELRNKWYRWHCFFVYCGQMKLCMQSAPLPIEGVKCVDNACTPFSSHPSSICMGNICTWNASWKAEQEEQTKRKSEYRWKT